MVPSVKRPVAVKARVVPRGRVGSIGVTCTEANAAAEMVRPVRAITPAKAAFTSVTPSWVAVMRPSVPLALEHPHTAHRHMVVQMPGGYRGIGSPIKLGRTPATYRFAPLAVYIEGTLVHRLGDVR